MASTGSKWRAALVGEDARRALALSDAIAASLPELLDNATLARGNAGLSLLREDTAPLEAALAQMDATPSLFSGFVGVAFALHVLDAGSDEAMAQLDAAVQAARPRYWDLTDGTIGLGVYLRARGLPAPTPDWRAMPEHLDFGLAHGVAGAIAYGCSDAIPWLRAHRKPHAMTEPRVHTHIVDGWCYGDLVTAYALGEPPPPAYDATIEGGICHGRAGRGLIYQAMGELELAAKEYALVEPVEELGFQSGNIGIALALRAACSDEKPAWLAALLL